MRRHDDGHIPRQSGVAPFRVLAATETSYLTAPPNVVAPPPPRAPEPYKITPASAAYGRAHRRSSFVIIAETRPSTPESRSPSPPSALATGRASPFRGRGFKGPPPRSRSRPPSPEIDGQRKRSRNERQGSVSQQNSPRRSLIPQPTRRRSISLTKNEASPKFGRRVDSRNRLNVTDSKSRLSVADSRSRTNLTDSRNRLNASDSKSRSTSNINGVGNSVSFARRQVSKPPTRLSPIQGTPTKPEKSSLRSTKNDQPNRSRITPRASPTKTTSSRYGLSPPKNAPNARKSLNDKSDRTSSKERVTSPSKIPLKTGKFGSTSSLNNNRFIKTVQPDKTSNKKNDRDSKQSSSDSNHANTNGNIENDQIRTDPKSNSSNNSERIEDMALLELLRQSSGATGTSSVVNTTTTTAAKPLHIDANTVLLDRDSGEKRSYAKCQDSSGGKSSNSATSKDDSPVVMSGSQNYSNGTQKGNRNDGSRSTNSQTSSRSNRVANDYYRTRNMDDKTDSPAGTDSISGQSRSSIQSVRNNQIKSNGVSGVSASNNTDRRSGIKNQEPSSIERNSESGSAKTDRTTNSKNTERINGRKNGEDTSSTSSVCVVGPAKSNETKTTEKGETSLKNAANKNVQDGNEISSSILGKVEVSGAKNVARTIEETRGTTTMTTTSNVATVTSTTSASSITNATTTTVTTTVTTTTKANGVSANSVAGVVNVRASANNNSGAIRPTKRDSNASLKSSGEASVGSIESIRSTDTGVSVDTVRGVSSPREKTGVHVVKRQEIETLSGNIVRLEQNGEPAVPAGSAEAERVPEKLLTRWRRSLSRYCERCPSMRCLACRRDPKDLLWARSQVRKQAKATMRSQAEASAAAPVSEAAAAATAAADATATDCWTRFKERCRCTRLRNVRCCMRKSRVAPAETTPCCPPERRIGAICRRAFSCCKCKRTDVERTKSIRAKHSLTSVAPPPLSEEPKLKLPDVLVEHNSLMRGAIPCLPVPLAWFCLVWNILLPGSGTVWSGIFNLCVGQPRFSPVASLKSRLGAFIVNLVVGVGQLFTVLFCLVGWGWSIWWGITMIRLAKKYKRFKASEAANSDPEARGGEPAALPPGVPSQALRGMERAR